MVVGGLLGSIASMGGKTMAGFGKAAKVGGKFFGGIQTTFVKGARGIKKGIELFKEVRKVAEGPMAGIFQLIEAFGILDPLFRVFAAIIKLFTAGFLIQMMPLFIRFLAIVTDPEYMRYVMALGAFFANTMIPALEAQLWVMESVQPFFGAWADFWEQGAANAGQLAVTIEAFQKFYILLGGTADPLRDFGMAVYNIAKWSIDTRAALERLMTLQVGVGGQGGGSGSTGGKGSTQSLGGAVRRLFGMKQEGTPFINRTGPYLLHRGESVGSLTDNLAKESQMNDLLMMQEESLSINKKTLHFMKYGV